MHACMHVCTSYVLCMHVCTYVYIYMCVCVYMCVCTCVCIQIFKPTFTHTLSHSQAGLCPRIDAQRAGRAAGVLALVQVCVCVFVCMCVIV